MFIACRSSATNCPCDVKHPLRGQDFESGFGNFATIRNSVSKGIRNRFLSEDPDPVTNLGRNPGRGWRSDKDISSDKNSWTDREKQCVTIFYVATPSPFSTSLFLGKNLLYSPGHPPPWYSPFAASAAVTSSRAPNLHQTSWPQWGYQYRNSCYPLKLLFGASLWTSMSVYWLVGRLGNYDRQTKHPTDRLKGKFFLKSQVNDHSLFPDCLDSM